MIPLGHMKSWPTLPEFLAHIVHLHERLHGPRRDLYLQIGLARRTSRKRGDFRSLEIPNLLQSALDAEEKRLVPVRGETCLSSLVSVTDVTHDSLQNHSESQQQCKPADRP